MRNGSLVRCLMLLRMLQQRGRWPLDELARTFAVTTRTVRRDLAALEDAGYPIASEPADGRGQRSVTEWWLA